MPTRAKPVMVRGPYQDQRKHQPGVYDWIVAVTDGQTVVHHRFDTQEEAVAYAALRRGAGPPMAQPCPSCGAVAWKVEVPPMRSHSTFLTAALMRCGGCQLLQQGPQPMCNAIAKSSGKPCEIRARNGITCRRHSDLVSKACVVGLHQSGLRAQCTEGETDICSMEGCVCPCHYRPRWAVESLGSDRGHADDRLLPKEEGHAEGSGHDLGQPQEDQTGGGAGSSAR